MTTDSDFYSFCNLPALPDWLIAEIRKSIEVGFRLGKNLQFESRPISSVEADGFKKLSFELDGAEQSRAVYRRYNLSEKAANWVKENVGDFSEVGSQLMRNGSAFTPHTDGGPRRYILNYLVDAGGDSVETQFFLEPGKDIVREGVPLQLPNSHELQLLAKVVAPEKSWMVLYGKIVHAVVGITGKRIQLSISFSAEEFKKLKEKHKLELRYYG